MPDLTGFLYNMRLGYTVRQVTPFGAECLDDAAKIDLSTVRKVVRRILKDIPARSRLLIPELLAPVATVALVLKARSKRIVPVWWDGKSYQLFPRGN